MFEFVNKIYVINLDHETERWASVQKELQNNGITEYERVPGVYLNNAQTFEDRDFGGRLAHMKALEIARDCGYSRVIIFEDDVSFDKRLGQYEPLIAPFLDSTDWDIFYLGCNHCGPVKRITDNIVQVSKSAAAHSYVVNSESINKILRYKDFPKSYDAILTDLIQTDGKCFSITPRLTIQSPGVSFIQGIYRNYNAVLKDL